MAISGTYSFSVNFSPVFRCDVTSASGNLKRNLDLKRLAVSTEQTSTSTTTTGFAENGRTWKKSTGEEGDTTRRVGVEVSEEPERNRKSLKDYFGEVKDLIRSDGGPPRWFSPLESRSHTPDSPLLLFLPGIDGVGLGLIMQHQRLGQIFDIWSLHIPVEDRTSFTDLVKLVERTVMSENHRLPNRPIYLVGESLGACIALAVAAHIPDMDLVLILANPATSFSKSQMQPLIPILKLLPDQGPLSVPFILKLIEGNPLRMAVDNLVKGLPLGPTFGELSQNLLTMSSYLSVRLLNGDELYSDALNLYASLQFMVVADILPKQTLLWKLEMLRLASAYANSRLHAVKAQTLILSRSLYFGMVYSVSVVYLNPLLEKHLLEDGVDLVTVLKGAGFYRRGKYIDYVSDFMPPTPTEFKKLHESSSYEVYDTKEKSPMEQVNMLTIALSRGLRWIYLATGPVLLSTLDGGKIVRGLSGIPSEGPVLFVGYHMLLGLELFPLVSQFMIERNIVLRGIAHPLLFTRLKDGSLPELSTYDSFRMMGAVPVSATNFYKLLSSKSHVLLYPGGMREALHRKDEEYKLHWPEQSEFVRMAARFGAKIVPFGVVGEDDIGQVVFDYDDLMKIPYFRAGIDELTNEVVKLRIDASGEVANQDIHLPGILPKVPGRFYYYFGKPIETEGRKQELRDRKKCHELYLEVKSEVEKSIAYLKEKRENDPYRNLLPRLMYQTTHGFTSEVPTFDL
ncbi:hypothetical protein JRO89_XS01G0212400 [Xanthoceras sorbifolium]|uniref:Uncharacterized protein n=1 Tax=Xanthoceras sorbifolium TaxID=99658 RepID=A0ABQ8IL38_9ROSI|nr:hypothetical protein JRO89_XS01G0212400 [Xanthoceras sorbifolium]